MRATREAQGLRVETAAGALGLARDVVIALEADDYARLGAPVYVRGYLRKYARYLDLPGDELVARYERGAAPREPELTARLSPIAVPRRGKGGHWLVGIVVVIVIVILVIAALWGWHYARRTRKTTQIPPAAAASAAPVFARNSVSGGLAALPPAVTRVPARVAASAPGDVSAAGAAPVLSAVEPAAAGVAGKPQLTLHLTTVSWVEVRGADHTRLFYGLAPAGKTLHFGGKHGALTVYLGNAAGVKVEVDGKPYPIPAASRKGDTARFTVSLAPAYAPAAVSVQ